MYAAPSLVGDHWRTEVTQSSNGNCSIHTREVIREMVLRHFPRLRCELAASRRVVPHVIVEALHSLVNPDYISVVSYVLCVSSYHDQS